MKSIVKSVAVASLLALGVASTANAAVYRWSFNYNGVSGGEFAFLDFDDVTKDFRMEDNNGQFAGEGFASNNYLTTTIGVNGIAFDFGLNSAPTFLSTPISTGPGAWGNVSINDFTASSANPNPGFTGDTGSFDIGFTTASNADQNEINVGESTMFKLSNDISNTGLAGVALRLNFNNGGLNANGGGPTGNIGSIWIVGQRVNSGAPVPEAGTSAMMALGLGLIGFVASRRKKA